MKTKTKLRKLIAEKTCLYIKLKNNLDVLVLVSKRHSREFGSITSGEAQMLVRSRRGCLNASLKLNHWKQLLGNM